MTTGRPKAILFDWDNTLVDAWPAINRAMNAAFEAFGLETWTLEETRARVRLSLRDSFPGMFGDDWKKARKIFYRTYAAVHLETLKPLAGTEPVLEWLAGEGLWLGVVSNKAGKYLREEAEALGWTRYFGRIVGATDAAKDKPAAAPVALALKGSGVAPGRAVWFVGDGAIDVQCAVNSGLTPVLLGGDAALNELDRHNLVQFVPPKYRVQTIGVLKTLVMEDGDAISPL